MFVAHNCDFFAKKKSTCGNSNDPFDVKHTMVKYKALSNPLNRRQIHGSSTKLKRKKKTNKQNHFSGERHTSALN